MDTQTEIVGYRKRPPSVRAYAPARSLKPSSSSLSLRRWLKCEVNGIVPEKTPTIGMINEHPQSDPMFKS